MSAPERELKRYLRELSEAVTAHLSALDAEMAQPSDFQRGSRIAKLANALDLVNDRVRYFALGVNYRTDMKARTAARTASLSSGADTDA